jgi:hypothetical protein
MTVVTKASPHRCSGRGHDPRSRPLSTADRMAYPWVMKRLWDKVQVGAPDECWPFVGSRVSGYGRIGLGGREKGTVNAHRVVCEFAHGLPRPGEQARHLCGNRPCCNPAHLAWGTQSANEMDKVAHDLSNRGERHGLHKVNAEQVLEIRARYAEGERQSAIAADFGIAQQSVSEIVTGRTWAWLRDSEEVMPI